MCESTLTKMLMKCDKFVRVFIEAGDAEYAFETLFLGKLEWDSNEKLSQIKADLRQVIVDAKDPEWAFRYCSDIEIDAEMRQIILDAGDPQWASYYCSHVENDADMRQIILDAVEPQWAFVYCWHVKNSADMRQIILDAKDPQWAYQYCRDVQNDAQMRQVIIDSGDPLWIRNHCYYVGDDDGADMRQALIESGGFEYVADYVIEHKNDEQMRQYLLDNIDKLPPVVAKKLYTYMEASDEIRSKLKQVIIDNNAAIEAYEICCGVGYIDNLAQIAIESMI